MGPRSAAARGDIAFPFFKLFHLLSSSTPSSLNRWCFCFPVGPLFARHAKPRIGPCQHLRPRRRSVVAEGHGRHAGRNENPDVSWRRLLEWELEFGDSGKREEALRVFFAALLLAPLFLPVISGSVSTFTAPSPGASLSLRARGTSNVASSDQLSRSRPRWNGENEPPIPITHLFFFLFLHKTQTDTIKITSRHSFPFLPPPFATPSLS